MRCTQPMGLPPEAYAFLLDNTVRRNVCPTCNRDDGPVCEVIGSTGMFDDLPLHQYTLTDGRTATEFVQAEVWSSGPMIWLALDLSDGTKIEWPPEEIE